MAGRKVGMCAFHDWSLAKRVRVRRRRQFRIAVLHKFERLWRCTRCPATIEAVEILKVGE